jgi:hypothetical protein
MKPDASKHNPDPAYLRELIKQSGLGIRETARRLGISDRHFRAYIADPEAKSFQRCPYPVQFCLEVMAATAQLPGKASTY